MIIILLLLWNIIKQQPQLQISAMGHLGIKKGAPGKTGSAEMEPVCLPALMGPEKESTMGLIGLMSLMGNG